MLHLMSSPTRSLLTTPVADEKTNAERSAVAEIVEKVQTSATMGENCSAVLAAIVTHFDILIGSGNLRSAHLPVLLQQVLVVLIMCTKEAGNLSIVEQDITAALNALKVQLPAERASALLSYKKSDLSVLLAEGIQLYNQTQHHNPTHKDIFFDSQENYLQHIPDDIHPFKNQLSPLKEQLLLSLTCKHQHQLFWTFRLNAEGKSKITTPFCAKKLFLENPKYRLNDADIPTDQLGIDYLQKELGVNCGPLTIQKIKNGELTIEQARKETNDKEKRAKIRQEVINFLERSDFAQDLNLEEWDVEKWDVDLLTKYIIDGSLTITPDNIFSYGYSGYTSLEDKAVQKYVDNGKMNIAEMLNYEGDSDDKDRFVASLNSPGVQKYLDKDMLTVKQLFAAPDIDGFVQALDRPGIQKYLDNKKLTIQQLLYMPNRTGFSKALKHSKIQFGLDSEALTIGQLTNLLNIHEFVDALDRLRSFSEDNGFVYHDMDVTVQQLINAPNISAFATVSEHLHIKRSVRGNDITIQQLINLPNIVEFSRAIYNKYVYKLLANNKLSIPQLINLPNLSALVNALNHQQVRKKLKQNELTIEQLINAPNITEFVNGLLTEPALQSL